MDENIEDKLNRMMQAASLLFNASNLIKDCDENLSLALLDCSEALVNTVDDAGKVDKAEIDKCKALIMGSNERNS